MSRPKSSCLLDSLGHLFFSYSSVRYVNVQNKKAGLLYHGMQITVLFYIVFIIFWQKSYQTHEPPIVSFYTKIKGSAYLDGKIVDTNDLIMGVPRIITTNRKKYYEVPSSLTTPLIGTSA